MDVDAEMQHQLALYVPMLWTWLVSIAKSGGLC